MLSVPMAPVWAVGSDTVYSASFRGEELPLAEDEDERGREGIRQVRGASLWT